MGFLEFLAAGAAPEAAAADEYPNGAMRWSDPHTWGGSLPASGEAVTVDVGRTLIIDQDIDVGSLHIKGTAIVERRDISIGAEWILVEGAGALVSFRCQAGDGCLDGRGQAGKANGRAVTASDARDLRV